MNTKEPKGILLVGYFLSTFSHGRCVCEDLAIHLEKKGYKIVKTSDKLNRYLRVVDIVMTIIFKSNEYQAAYVEVYNGLAFVWAELACRLLHLLRKPYIITLHGARLIQFAEKWPVRVMHILQRADRVTTPSKLFKKNFSPWRPDIVYLPNAIDLTTYHFMQRSNPTPKLGWLRKFEKIYNPTLAIDTLANVKNDFPNVRLFMGGGDNHDGSSDEVRKIAEEKKLINHLVIPGFISHAKKLQWFDSFDIFLNTTFVESFGIAVLEAAACGLCIVSTNVGEIPYLWEDGEDAMLVPPNDPDIMAVAVKKLLTEPGLAKKLSQNARRKAEKFDWSIILPQWEALFSEIINGHGGGRS